MQQSKVFFLFCFVSHIVRFVMYIDGGYVFTEKKFMNKKAILKII